MKSIHTYHEHNNHVFEIKRRGYYKPEKFCRIILDGKIIGKCLPEHANAFIAKIIAQMRRVKPLPGWAVYLTSQ